MPQGLNDRMFPIILDLALGKLEKYGIVRPKEGILKQIDAGRIPVIDVGTVAAIKAGRIKVAPDIKRFGERGATFVDGRQEDFDAVILATGYRPAYDRFLPAEIRPPKSGVNARASELGLYLGTGVNDGLGFVAAGDDDMARRQYIGSILDPEAVRVAADGVDRHAEAWPELETLGIGVEIGDHLLARHVARMVTRERHEGQRGERLYRVQMQPPVMPPPGRRHLRGLLEHDEIHPCTPQAGADGKTGRPGADNHDIGIQAFSSPSQVMAGYDGGVGGTSGAALRLPLVGEEAGWEE
jgi:hypothetical protein